MKIAIFSYIDYGNVGWGWSNALRSVGHEADAYAVASTNLGNPRRAEQIAMEEVSTISDRYDVSIIMHSQAAFIPLVNDKPYFVMHGGSKYRQQSGLINGLFKDARAAFIQTADLLGLGAHNEHLVYAAADPGIEYRKPTFKAARFAHYPSSRFKGTKEIIETFARCAVPLETNSGLHRFESNLNRMASALVYIEHVQPHQQGKPYGHFGVTAIEAALLGRVVVSIGKQYNPPLDKMMLVSSPDELGDVITALNKLSELELIDRGIATRDEALRVFDPKVIGQQLSDLITQSI